MKRPILIAFCAMAATVALAQSRSSSEAPKAYWGFEGGGGYSWVPQALADQVQNKYTATLTGTSYSFGLDRFHANGSPSFTLQFMRFSLDAKAVDQQTGIAYSGHVDVPGFMATKHVNFMARQRFSFGMSFGAGVGPQLTANYQQTSGPTGVPGPQKTYTLKEIPVTPMFEILFRGDIRIQRHLSIGPYAGIRTGFPVVGGVLRVHFPRS